MPSATPRTSSTTRRSRCPTDTFSAITAAIGAKNGRWWCSRSLATSQANPAATAACAANSSAARTRRQRSLSVARDRWPNSLSAYRATAIGARLIGYGRRLVRFGGLHQGRRIRRRSEDAREVRDRLGRRLRERVLRLLPPAPHHDVPEDHHAAQDERAAEGEGDPDRRRTATGGPAAPVVGTGGGGDRPVQARTGVRGQRRIGRRVDRRVGRARLGALGPARARRHAGRRALRRIRILDHEDVATEDAPLVIGRVDPVRARLAIILWRPERRVSHAVVQLVRPDLATVPLEDHVEAWAGRSERAAPLELGVDRGVAWTELRVEVDGAERRGVGWRGEHGRG